MTAAKKEDEERAPPKTEEGIPEPPDGGWGWVVVFCSFMIHVIADGVAYTFGIFYVEFLRYFGESKGATSWVASIMVGTTFCVGPFASGLTNQFGCRTVTIVGSLLATFGLVISTFAPSIMFLYFSIGICTGTGFGLMYLPAIVSVSCYFERKRAFATGIAVCGSGIGTAVMAPVVEWAVAQWGWQGAMLFTAGLVLNCCIFGALIRPLEPPPQKKNHQAPSERLPSPPPPPCNGVLRKGSLPNGTIGSNGEASRLEALRASSLLGIDDHPPTLEIRQAASMTLSTSSLRLRSGSLSRKDIFYSGNIPQPTSDLYIYEEDEGGQQEEGCLCPRKMRDASRDMVDFRLMGNLVFVMFGLSNFFTNIGFNVPYVYTKDRAIELRMADEAHASLLLSLIGAANTVGRVVLGYLSDRSCVNRLWLYNGSLALCGFATVFSSLCGTYFLMGVYAVIFGATAGAYVSLTSVILVDLLGLEALTNSFGLLLLFEGVACLIGPPITGWLHDYTGSYDPGFYTSGLMIAISGLMLFFIPCVESYQEKRKHKAQTVEIKLSPSNDSPSKIV